MARRRATICACLAASYRSIRWYAVGPDATLLGTAASWVVASTSRPVTVTRESLNARRINSSFPTCRRWRSRRGAEPTVATGVGGGQTRLTKASPGGGTAALRHRMSPGTAESSPKEAAMAEPVQFNLSADDLPTAWYNILPDLPAPPLPPVHPATGEPIGPDALAPLFPMSLIMQEVSTERWHDIPGAVLDVYRMWRPTPLFRARRLEQALQTPARLYFKYEGTSPAGSPQP